MFIRRVQTRPRAGSQQPYASFRLVRSVRSGSSVRQLTLLNLGAHFSVPQQQWPALCELVATIRSGLTPLIEPAPDLLQAAQQIADRLSLSALPDSASDDLAHVHLDSLDHRLVRSVGPERLALHALRELRFTDALHDLGVSSRDARIASALVLARMLHPSSEREAHAWLSQHSAALELLGLDSGAPLSLAKLYRIGDLLWHHRQALETALFRRERCLLELPPTIAFYDLTNVHYHGRPRADLRHGRSKQKRADCPLVTLGLTLDAAGFPCRSEILPGNVSEPATLAKAITRLGQLLGDGPRPTVVMDAGLSTAENIAWLRAQGYDWITVRRGGADPPAQDPELSFRTRHGTAARAWRLRSADGESELCLWSEERQAKDDAILAKQRERFESELRSLHEGLAKKGCTKRYDKVVERLGRLKERYKRVSRQYELHVEQAQPAPTGQAGPTGPPDRKAQRPKSSQPRLAEAVRWERNDQHARKDARAGTYVLRTSHTDWDLERVARTYWQLTEIEATFRSLKSEIGLRPIWHAKQERIRAHLFIAVLAYHGVHLLRRRLGARGIHDSWETIRRKLANWMRLTTTLVTAGGERIECRQDSRPDQAAAALARAAGVQPQLHRVRTRTPVD